MYRRHAHDGAFVSAAGIYLSLKHSPRCFRRPSKIVVLDVCVECRLYPGAEYITPKWCPTYGGFGQGGKPKRSEENQFSPVRARG